MKAQTCCFTGHRSIPLETRAILAAKLEATLRRLIAAGVVYFGAGGAVGFDMMAAQTVLRLREEFSQVRLIMVLPCKDQADTWGERDRQAYIDILRRADKVVYQTQTYTDECMLARNRRLVDGSGICVAYLTHYGGGTGYTVAYAEKQGLQVINLA